MKNSYLKVLVVCAGLLLSIVSKAQPCNIPITYLSGSTCQGTPYLFNGLSLDTSGTYYDTIAVAGGCDSILSLQLFVTPTIYHVLYDTICQGTTFIFVGQSLTQAGTYGDTLFSTVTGCDSVILLHLFVNNAPHPRDTINYTFCSAGGPNSYYDFYGRHLHFSGTYTDTVAGSALCDSIIVLNLTVIQGGFTPPQNATICAGLTYDFYGRPLTVAGTYYDTLQASTGCDSIIRLTLTIGTSVKPPTINATVCPGSFYIFRGISYAPGNGGGGGGGGGGATYHDTIVSAGCDTIFTITVRRTNNVPFLNLTDSFCQGGTYLFRGQTFTTAGRDTLYLPAGTGCDTVVYLRLNYKAGPPAPSITRTGDILVAVAASNLTFQWYLDGQPITGATTQAITATQNGSYTVDVSEPGSCTVPSPAFVLTNVGIQNVATDGSFKLYPNPNSGKFTLEVQQYLNTEVVICDVYGRVVYQKQLSAANEMIDMTGAATGTYYMSMKNNGMAKYAHFVIAR